MIDKIAEIYNKHILIENRITQLENTVANLQKQIEENTHYGRICPGCGKKSLQFPNKEYQAFAGQDRNGKNRYTIAQKLVAVCQSCGWEYDDPEFIKNRLHKL